MSTPTLRVVPDAPVAPVYHLMDAASLLAIAAITTGLPAPTDIHIDDHAILISLGNEDALNTWATWLRTEIDVFNVGDQIRYRSARTEKFGAPVVVSFTEEVDS